MYIPWIWKTLCEVIADSSDGSDDGLEQIRDFSRQIFHAGVIDLKVQDSTCSCLL